jgi:hypothetical protein
MDPFSTTIAISATAVTITVLHLDQLTVPCAWQRAPRQDRRSTLHHSPLGCILFFKLKKRGKYFIRVTVRYVKGHLDKAATPEEF